MGRLLRHTAVLLGIAMAAVLGGAGWAADDPLPIGNTVQGVERDNKSGWKIHVSSGAVTFEENRCAPTPPPPHGALHLVVRPGTPGALTYARLRSTRYHRTYLRDLTRLDYYTCDVKNNGRQWPLIALEIDWDGNGRIDDELTFEPTYQNPVDGGLCGLGSNQGPPVLEQWQFWDALRKDPATGAFRACWWSVNDPTFPPGNVIRPLHQYLEEHPDAAIVNLDGNHGGVQVLHGSASETDSYDGWVDVFTIGKDMKKPSGQTENSTITYDFIIPRQLQAGL